MEFGEKPVEEAQGAILAHSVKHGAGVFKKGRKLNAEDIARLQSAGVTRVFVARLGAGDVAEDEAAAMIATAIAGRGTVSQAPFTGRANLHAAARGIAVVDGPRVGKLNRLHESLTLATVAPFAVVDSREMVATVKIIPFSVPQQVLNKALDIVGDMPIIRVEAFKAKCAGLIITMLAQTKPSIAAKSEAAIRERVGALGGSLTAVETVGHRIEEVAAAIARQKAMGCDPILVFGASAIVDRGDVIPAGVVAAGGEVVHLGMPVDPGNLMMFGRHGKASVLGVPSCARSPKLNGFDWVLERVMADVPVSGEDIMDMGAGGLLAEIPTRPSPREGKPKVQKAPRVAAIVLAAGASSRMGSNKLLQHLGSASVIHATVAAVTASPVDMTIVVTGRDGDDVAKALGGLPVTRVHNAGYAEGLSTSLRAGLRAVPEDMDAALVCLGDMPLVDPGAIGRLIAAFNPTEHRSICVSAHRGGRGNPVLWGRQHFSALKAITGDRGARSLIDRLPEEVVDVEMPDASVLTDIDTPEQLQKIRSGLSA